MRGAGDAVGAWVLDRLLGEGGNGRVWLARHEGFGTRAAVKLTHQAQPRDVAAFQAEVRRVARLDHPYIVQLFDAGVDRGVPWYAMEALRGSLRDVSGTLGWDHGHRVLLGLLDALAHAHAHGLIHRDVKPENVLIEAHDRPVHLRLSDFGLAIDRDRVGRTGEIAGSPFYMAPEQRDGDWRRYGPWTDLYAVGRIALELFGPTAELPEGLQAWVDRTCDPDPTRRFARAADARVALMAVAPRAEPARPVRSNLPRATGATLVRHRLPPVVGREREQQAVRAALSSATAEGRARLLLLGGPAGVGKSHLAHAACVEAHHAGRADWIRVRPGSSSAVDPGLGRALAAHLRAADLCRDALDDHLAERLPNLDPTARSLVAARWVEGRLDLPVPLLVALVRALCAERPLVLWLDDVARSPGAVGLTGALLGLDAPLLVLATADDDDLQAELDGQLSGDRAERLVCNRLDDDAVGELLASLVPIDAALRARLTSRVAGNPLLAVTLLDDWQERGLLVEGFQGWSVAPGAVLPLPTDLADAALGRVERALGDVDGHAIEIAAIAGDPVDPGLWERACAEAGLVPDRAAVGRLVEARLAVLEGADGGWRWSHPMVRESLVQRAEDAGRDATWHRACATALADGIDPATRERRVRHLVAAGAPLEADPDALALADQLIQASAIGSSEALLAAREEALHLAGVPESHSAWGAGWCRWATLSQYRGDFARAERWLARAEAHASDPWVAARIALVRGMLATMGGHPDEARRSFSEATQLARETGDPSLIGTALANAARVGTKASDPSSSIRLATEAVDLLRPLDRPEQLADALQALANGYTIAGEPESARPVLDEAIAIARRVGAPGTLFHALNLRGVNAHLSGNLATAERDYSEAVAMRDAVELGLTSTSIVDLNLAVLRIDRGDFSRARALLEPMRAASADQRRPMQELMVASFLLPCLAHDGEWERVGADLDLAAGHWAAIRYTEPGVIRMLERTAHLAEAQSRPELARAARALAEEMRAALPG